MQRGEILRVGLDAQALPGEAGVEEEGVGDTDGVVGGDIHVDAGAGEMTEVGGVQIVVLTHLREHLVGPVVTLHCATISLAFACGRVWMGFELGAPGGGWGV